MKLPSGSGIPLPQNSHRHHSLHQRSPQEPFNFMAKKCSSHFSLATRTANTKNSKEPRAPKLSPSFTYSSPYMGRGGGSPRRRWQELLLASVFTRICLVDPNRLTHDCWVKMTNHIKLSYHVIPYPRQSMQITKHVDSVGTCGNMKTRTRIVHLQLSVTLSQVFCLCLSSIRLHHSCYHLGIRLGFDMAIRPGSAGSFCESNKGL